MALCAEYQQYQQLIPTSGDAWEYKEAVTKSAVFTRCGCLALRPQYDLPRVLARCDAPFNRKVRELVIT